ncbi:MAG: cytochrome P450 [Acidimicrobiia bacterium]
MTTSEAEPLFNPFAPGYAEDPYPQYRQLREQAPVYQSLLGPWVLSHYADVVHVLRDSSLSVEERNATPTDVDPAIAEVFGDRNRGQRAILNIDPPDHDRLRRLVSKAFTPKMVESLRPEVERLVNDALDAVVARGTGRMDLIGDLAFPLPFTVISEMLGMPTGRRDELRTWSHAVVKTLDPILTLDEARAAAEASDAMVEYVLEVIAAKRRDPADDLLSGLIAAEEDGDVLDEQELLDQVILLYIAGHETTVNLIGNGTLALLRHRVQLERLRADPSLDQNAVEELLRFDSPVQFSRRIAIQDFELHGQLIEAGSFVLTCLGAANRDPQQWGDTADELDLGRTGAAQHVSFGSGVHHCLGASLARVEGRAAFGALVRRFPDLELADDHPVWNGRVVLRGLDALDLAYDRSATSG